MLKDIYYPLKPFIPRWLQIALRRNIARRRLRVSGAIWPIDEKASKPPENWSGWPDGRRFALVLTHDVEKAEGQERCIQLATVEESLGFRSLFNFVAEGYHVSATLRSYLKGRGFEIGVHGLTHNGNPFRSKEIFQKQAIRISSHLKEWGSVGFRSPCMYHNLEWISELDIEYDSSSFDTDPFEPQPDGMGTIFPFWVGGNSRGKGYVELPYTLPQDHCLFIILQEKDISIWRKKLDWIAQKGGMALLCTHPDYMKFDQKELKIEEYPSRYYEEFIEYVKRKYEGQYWHVLPKELAKFWKQNQMKRQIEVSIH